MQFQEIVYTTDGPLGVITLNAPQYKNAQGYRMLDEIDAAFDLAHADKSVRVVIVRGSGGNFSSGHDLGTPEAVAYRRNLGAAPGIETYDQFRKYNLDLLLKWRNFEKPTIAMVEGYCIYAGWMLAACCDIVFAADDAQFLAGFVEYMSIPWDIGIRRAKELCFESRFISADEAAAVRLRQPRASRRPISSARPMPSRGAWRRIRPARCAMAKIQMNKAQDAQGFTRAVDDSFGDYFAMMNLLADESRVEGGRRLTTVDLAVKGKKGERFGL